MHVCVSVPVSRFQGVVAVDVATHEALAVEDEDAEETEAEAEVQTRPPAFKHTDNHEHEGLPRETRNTTRVYR